MEKRENNRLYYLLLLVPWKKIKISLCHSPIHMTNSILHFRPGLYFIANNYFLQLYDIRYKNKIFFSSQILIFPNFFSDSMPLRVHNCHMISSSLNIMIVNKKLHSYMDVVHSMNANNVWISRKCKICINTSLKM